MFKQSLHGTVGKVNDFNYLVKPNENGIITTTSLKIAEIFGRNHKEVLRIIGKLLQNLPDEWGKRNFTLSTYFTVQNKELPMYTLTRDAFTLLAMGFTGEKALQWKLKYIEAFNAMEQMLWDKEIKDIGELRQKDLDLAREISYQQGFEYAQSLPAIQIESKKAYLKGLEEGKKIRNNKDNWHKMEKALEYLGKGVSLKDTAKLVGLCPETIRRRFRKLGLWEQVKNGDLWFNMPARKITRTKQLSLI